MAKWAYLPHANVQRTMDSSNNKARLMRRRGIYVLPNLLTTGGMFAGFYAIVAAIDGNYHRSIIAIFIAMVLDGADGRVARLTGTESEFGKQYDSLSDMVAFGLAPAIIVYQWGIIQLAEHGWIWSKLGWLAAFMYAVAAALRLARFNVISRTADRRFFEGLASPPAAALVTSMVALSAEQGWSGVPLLAAVFLTTAGAGALMVSRLAYYSFKEVSAKGRISFTYVLAIPLTFVLIALDPPKVIFALASTYVLSGVLFAVWRAWKRRRTRQQSKGSAADSQESSD